MSHIDLEYSIKVVGYTYLMYFDEFQQAMRGYHLYLSQVSNQTNQESKYDVNLTDQQVKYPLFS